LSDGLIFTGTAAHFQTPIAQSYKTFESITNHTATGNWHPIASHDESGAQSGDWLLYFKDSNTLLYLRDGLTGSTSLISTVQTGSFCSIALRSNGTNWQGFLNGTAAGSAYANASDLGNNIGTYKLRVGRYSDETRYFLGSIDEVRVSTVDRSDAWIKTTHYSLFDTLVTYKSSTLHWTPDNISTDLWLDMSDDTTVTLDISGKIEQVVDKSGNDRHVSQASSALRPARIAMNGRCAGYFNSSNYLSGSNLGVGSGSFTVFVVASHYVAASASVYRGLFEFGTNTTGGFAVANYPHSTRQRIEVINGLVIDSTPIGSYPNAGVPAKILEFQKVLDTSLKVFLDAGEQLNSVVAGLTAALSSEGNFRLGYQGGTSAGYWYGEIGEIIVIGSELDQETTKKIQGYLAHKWKIEDQLPLGHIYKSTAPSVLAWDNKVKFTIDSSKVDSDLTDFPILVKISAESGIASTDLSRIFSTITYENRKKIAVSLEDESTQCYVEIERWDDIAQEAWLHVKVPSISSDINTVLYFWYDNTQEDNVGYIGDTGETVAQNVWDSNFILVTHLSTPTTGASATINSTGLGNGTPTNMAAGALVAGQVADAHDFDGSNDYIDFGDLFYSDEVTIEAVIKPDALVANKGIIHKRNYPGVTAANTEWSLGAGADGQSVSFFSGNGGTICADLALTGVIVTTAFQYIAAGHGPASSGIPFCQCDLTELTGAVRNSTVVGNTSNAIQIAARTANNDARYFDGIIDEVRVSNIARSYAWRKATYHSLFDGLVTFEFEGEDPYRDDVVLRLPFNTNVPNAYYGQGTDFQDFSPIGNPVSYYGNAAMTTGQAKFGTHSFYSSGTSPNHLEVPGIHFSPSENFTAKGAVNCTIELWVYQSAAGTIYLCGSGTPGSGTGTTQNLRQGLRFAIESNKLVIRAGNLSRDGDTGYYYQQTVESISSGSWSWIVICINSNVITVWIDGTKANLEIVNASYTATDLSNVSTYTTDNFLIGGAGFHEGVQSAGSGSNGVSVACYTDDIRITRDSIRYSGEQIAVPTEPLHVETGWLGTWANRRKIIIDHSKIDSDLEHFPILININNSSGVESENFSDIYALIGSTRRRIAFTLVDGTTQIVGELNRTSEDAGDTNFSVWVRVPSLNSSVNTELWMYFDPSQADNPFVGSMASIGQRVWDSNFMIVCHMENPIANALQNSTGRTNGTNTNMAAGALVDGPIAKAFDYDGSNDYTDFGDVFYSDEITIEAIIKPDTFGKTIINKTNSSGVTSGTFEWIFTKDVNRNIRILGFNSSTNLFTVISAAELSTEEFQYISGGFGVASTGIPFVQVNLVETQGSTRSATVIGNTTNRIQIGARYSNESTRYFDGIIDEVRISNVARSYAWRKATYYTLFDSLVSFSTIETIPHDWDEYKKYELTIAGEKIDEELLNFPITIKLSAYSGINAFDVSYIFSELSSASKKIAVFTDEGYQCFVEIEKWDDVAQEAWLHVKVPRILDSENKKLYLYYDSTHADNTDYVGLTGETVAQNVWDSNFILVTHLSTPTTGAGATLNSTGLGNGTPTNMAAGALVDGKVAKGHDFDGTNDYVDFGDLFYSDQLTIESIIKPDVYTTFKGLVIKRNSSGVTMNTNNQEWGLSLGDNGKSPIITGWNAATALFNFQGTGEVSTDSFQYVAAGTGPALTGAPFVQINDIQELSGTTRSSTVMGNTTNRIQIGVRTANLDARYFDGIIDEVRVSNIARSYAWRKATYYTLFDDLLTYDFKLLGWDHRIKLTIDSSKIDNDLTDFPVLIKLSNSSGVNSFDLNHVFTSISNDCKKIAITHSNSSSQCYVEIESWDSVNGVAWLHVKVPTIYSSRDTYLCLYYDSTHADNTDYVGNTGDAVAANVWDANFHTVWHLNQTPVGAGAVLNSVISSRHLSPVNMDASNLVDTKVGPGLDFNGTDECLYSQQTLSAGSYLLANSQKTIEMVVNHGAVLGEQFIGTRLNYVVNNESKGYVLAFDPDRYRYYHTGAGEIIHLMTPSVNQDYYCSFSVGSNGSTPVLYLDGSPLVPDTNTLAAASAESTTGYFAIARVGAKYSNGVYSEIRISSVQRSAAWMKATYYTLFDDLVAFAMIDGAVTFSMPYPYHLSTVYGTSHAVSLLLDVTSGLRCDVEFYSSPSNNQIDSTVSGLVGGDRPFAIMSTPSGGIDYMWYAIAYLGSTSFMSDVYTFTNRFMCSGTVTAFRVPASGVEIRLYRRIGGEFLGSYVTTSGGTFEIVTDYNEHHYAVALYPNNDFNGLIYDWLIP
jgi:hypothetical protein